MVQIHELRPGEEGVALAFLEGDPVHNLRIIWALRRWGLFNLGLPEQGKYMVASLENDISGMLFMNNQGILRLAAPADAALPLVERSLLHWGSPRLLVGPEDEVDIIISAFRVLESAIEYVEEETSMILEAKDFKPYRKKANLALLEDVEDLTDLEKRMQLEMLGNCGPAWVMRSQMLRAVEGGAATLVRQRGRMVSKAEMDATTAAADELGGVFTLPSKRGKGYAGACCSLLCRLSLTSGKKIRLETQRSNSIAIELYSRLGFRTLWPHLAVRFKA